MAIVGFVAADGVLLHLQRWTLNRRAFPSPRDPTVRIQVEGLPLIFCNEVGLSFLVRSFGWVTARSLQLVPAGSRTIVDVSVVLLGFSTVPTIVTFAICSVPTTVRTLVLTIVGATTSPLGFQTTVLEVKD